MSPLVRIENFQQFAAINLTADPGYDPTDRHIPSTAQISLNWNQEDGKQAHNILHASYTGGFHGTQSEADAILTGLGTGAQWTALAAFLTTSTTLASVSIRDLNVMHTTPISSLGAAHAGTSVDSAFPNEVAAVITLRTAQTGQAFRGRIYVPGWGANAGGSGNTIAAAAVTALQTWGSIIAGVLSASGYTFGIGHFSRLAYTSAAGHLIPARAPGLVPITTVQVRDNHWDTQRKRGLR
jgi:hypothetical protein